MFILKMISVHSPSMSSPLSSEEIVSVHLCRIGPS